MSKRFLGCGSHIFEPTLNLKISLELDDTLFIIMPKNVNQTFDFTSKFHIRSQESTTRSP